jgi:hypothetical protein
MLRFAEVWQEFPHQTHPRVMDLTENPTKPTFAGNFAGRGRGAKNNLDNNGTGSPTSRPPGQQATKVERFTE